MIFLPFERIVYKTKLSEEVIAITMGGFLYESRKSRNDLKMLFNAEIIDNP